MNNIKKVLSVFVLAVLGSTMAVADSHHTNSDALQSRLQSLSVQTERLQKELVALRTEMKELPRPPRARRKRHHKMSHREHQHYFPTVLTSPLLGLRSAYDAHDLVVNLPSMNEDLRLLRYRRQFVNTNRGAVLYENKPIIEMSGRVEGIASSTRGYTGVNTSDINVANAELDTWVEAGRWAMGFMSIGFDNSFLDPAVFGFGRRLNNSKLFLKRGFVTIGDLTHSPFYFSIGQMFVDFGRYSTMMVSAPMTLVLGRTNARAVNIGYAQHGLYVSAYAFRGDTGTGGLARVEQGGANAGYQFEFAGLHANMGVGYIANITDAEGFQGTGNASGTFQGFGQSAATELVLHRVPALNAHGEFDYGPYSLKTAYVGVLQSFHSADLTFNGLGARPRAMHLEGQYHFDLIGKPMGVGFAYDHSWEALALNIPLNSYTFIYSASLWKNTIASVEFRHDINYGPADIAGGRCSTTGLAPFCTTTVPGRKRNTILAQLGVYF